SLVRGTTYYWTVDETDGNNVVWQGPVWNFYVQSYYATKPDPPNEAINIDHNVLLSWQGGYNVVVHDVYIGTSWEDVNNAYYWDTTGIYQGYTIEPNYQCSNLAFNTRYYWRVDEVHGPMYMGPIYKGDVWCFTTMPHRIFVDVDAAGANNGSSWENAYNFLQDALIEADSALKPVEIRVAEGIYTPDSNSADPNGSGDRTATFQLINGVAIKGGYAGFGAPDPDARDIELYKTILSGDLDGNDVEVNDPCDLENEPTRAENSYHVVTGSDTDANAILDGFTITGGNADGAFPFYNKSGGGIYCYESSPTITNCIISGNSATHLGGGMHNDSPHWVGEGSSPTITNCTFIGNSALHGGGMFNDESSTSTLVNCIFIGNSADHYGGGMYNNSYPTITNCTFSGNSAEYCGGIWNYPPPPGDGSVSSVGGSSYIVTNNFLSGNIVTNCIIWGNSDSRGMDESAQIGTFGIPLIVNYSCVQGWTGGLGGIGNIGADPLFADTNTNNYHPKSQAGRWEPSSESWVKDDVTSPCIDAGNPGCPLGDEPEPNGNRRNMGAYGGTAEASKSPAKWRSIADLNNDWVVDSNDLKVFGGYWLEMGECIPSDLNRSQFVDFDDFAIFGLQWSYPTAFEPGMTFQIDDCNMEDGLSWTAAAESNEPRFSVWVEGRYIYFEDLMYANCCPEELGLDKEIN
ncbi:MAG: right-handed parallel beta-helix repeat-containing protein, partial [Planctomycetota bacterium]